MTNKNLYRNCVTPDGTFVYGIHKPSYTVVNLRQQDMIEPLGLFDDETIFDNQQNFPIGDLRVDQASWIIEIPNPLPFRGTTYIDKRWADLFADNPARMSLPKPQPLSFNSFLSKQGINPDLIDSLPRPLLLALATCSTDPADLIRLAEVSCTFIRDSAGSIAGLRYSQGKDGRLKAHINDHDLFEAVANNPALPDEYKKAMVLRPGAQGGSEIVGEWLEGDKSHVFEYLRRNSYIPGGHFAANMADDAVRYSIADLSPDDMHGLRHLYYQRMYNRLADQLGLQKFSQKHLAEEELEALRLTILERLDGGTGNNLSTLWGWNFGFDYSPTDYRLHASHQQIHQQYAVVPESIDAHNGSPDEVIGSMQSFACGDMVENAIVDYSNNTGSDLFTDYYRAVTTNVRMDGRVDLSASLIVWEDDNVMVFVPKAQTSQWELQIMTKPDSKGAFPGNVLETDRVCRASINMAILTAQQVLAQLGARMVTSIEYSKRIGERNRANQPLLYALLPKLPFSPGAFSEAQLRFINRHYPEDFAEACREKVAEK